jgi:predicted RNA polymerase sigma factor
MTNESAYKVAILERAYKSGRIGRYRFQDALARLHAAGELDDDLFTRLNGEAVAAGMAAGG